jgi:hypothetical protein
LFVYIINFLLPNIIEKQKLDQKVFNTANQNLLTTVSCLNDVWTVITRNNRQVNISYYQRDGEPLDCNITPDKNLDILVNCGMSGEYNIFNGQCYNAITNLLYLIS